MSKTVPEGFFEQHTPFDVQGQPKPPVPCVRAGRECRKWECVASGKCADPQLAQGVDTSPR